MLNVDLTITVPAMQACRKPEKLEDRISASCDICIHFGHMTLSAFDKSSANMSQLVCKYRILLEFLTSIPGFLRACCKVFILQPPRRVWTRQR